MRKTFLIPLVLVLCMSTSARACGTSAFGWRSRPATTVPDFSLLSLTGMLIVSKANFCCNASEEFVRMLIGIRR